MSIRKLLENPPSWREIPVEFGGATYVVRGRPDARLIGSTLYLPESEREVRARHWQRLLGEDKPFDGDMVGKVLLVHATLQPDPGEECYDETEIAKLAIEHGLLFLSLAGAALMAVGLAGSPDTTAEVAAAGPLAIDGQDGGTSPGTA